jgi:lipopolysaccharide biosynthesis glycosyltransferase
MRDGAEKKKTITLATAINDDYALPFAIMLFSLQSNSKRNYNIDYYVIDSGVSKAMKKKIFRILDSSLISLCWIPVSESLYNHLPLWGRGRSQSYHSLLIPKLSEINCDKLIYLDADLLVLENIETLYEEKIDDFMVGAVQDMVIPVVSAPKGLACYEELCISEKTPYFNSGVLLINLLKWRSENVVDKVVEYLSKYNHKINLYDQDGYNAVLSSSWKALDLRWNVIASVAGRPFFKAKYLDEEHYNRAIKDPWIVHYAGYFKPWLAYLGNRYDHIYREYLKKQNVVDLKIPNNLKGQIVKIYDGKLRNFFYFLERFLWNRLK